MSTARTRPRGSQRTNIDSLADAMPPNDTAAERTLLGSIIVSPRMLATVAPLVAFEDFYDLANGTIFMALCGMIREGIDCSDIPMLVSRMKTAGQLEAVGGIAYLNKIITSTGNAANAVYYALVVADKARRRRLFTTALSAATKALAAETETADLVAEVERDLREASRTRVDAVSVGEIAGEVVKDLRARIAKPHEAPAVFTGIVDVDQVLGGFVPEELIILAARASCGKTTFALQVAIAAAMREKRTLFVSLEMSETELILRKICGSAEVDYRLIRTAKTNNEDILAIEQQAERLRGLPLMVWAPAATTVEQLEAVCRGLNSQERLSCVFVDYLNLISSTDRRIPRHEQVAEITRGLKRMARNLRLPVVALAQLNREADGEEPRLKHLRESGSIEQDADIVLFLHQQDIRNKPERVRLTIAKHRSGEVGAIDLDWQKAAGRFTPPDHSWGGWGEATE